MEGSVRGAAAGGAAEAASGTAAGRKAAAEKQGDEAARAAAGLAAGAAAGTAAGAAAGAAEEEKKKETGEMDVVAACSSSKEVEQKLQQRLRDAAVPADVFWQDLHAYAADTCGGYRKADAVVAAFKTIHAKRLSSMNLEQTDALCKDVLTKLLNQP